MDREAWSAAVHGVAKSQTWLSNRTTISHLFIQHIVTKWEVWISLCSQCWGCINEKGDQTSLYLWSFCSSKETDVDTVLPVSLRERRLIVGVMCCEEPKYPPVSLSLGLKKKKRKAWKSRGIKTNLHLKEVVKKKDKSRQPVISWRNVCAITPRLSFWCLYPVIILKL